MITANKLTCVVPDSATEILLECSRETNAFSQLVDFGTIAAGFGALFAAAVSLIAVYVTYRFGEREHQRANRRDSLDLAVQVFEQRKHAEQVAAWLEPKGSIYQDTSVLVANHSALPIWNVVVNHDGFGMSKTVIIPVIAPGETKREPVGSWAISNFSPSGNMLLATNVRVTFVDVNNRTWQRPGGDVPLLREITPKNK